MGLALLAQSGLPSKFWDEAFTSACFLINRTPSKPLQFISPFEKLFCAKPDYHILRVFGCLCYPHTRPYNKHKLEFRSAASTFLGYSSSHKGYKALLPNGKIVISRDVTFDEHTFPFVSTNLTPHKSKPNLPVGDFLLPLSPIIPPTHTVPVVSLSPDNPPLQNHSHQHDNITPPSSPLLSSPHSPHTISPVPSDASSVSSQTPIQPTLSSVTAPAVPSHPMITRAKAGIFHPKIYLNTTYSKSSLVVSLVLPKSATAALLISVWKQAMEAEFLALLKNKTWTLTTLPPGKNFVGCTWIFKLKKHANGSVARHKARLVAQGFSQQPGFDYTETFSPVVKPTTIRLILSIAVSSNWGITHLDVNNAFLHGDLQEEIYMRQPQGFEQGGPDLVCKLNKAIYGLKQASRAWFLTVQGVLFSLGFSQSKADTSLFYRVQDNETIYILIYVDDMLVTGSSSSGIKRVIQQLSDHFSLKDLGEVSQFLGIEVTHSVDGIHLSQSTYIKELLEKFRMQDAKGQPTPMISNSKLSKVEGNPVADGKAYRSAVGALQYATITRPEIAFSVNKVSQFMASPLDAHWKAVKRIFRYLAGTTDYGLHIKRSRNIVKAFSDSDWSGDVNDRKSVTGYCVYHGENLISWCSKKQSVVSRSSTEAEYRSLAQAAAEVSWIISILGEIGMKSKGAPIIWVDNLSTIALASNPVLHVRTKHIELDVHFVRDKVAAKQIELRHVPSYDQVADIFTKPLGIQFFSRLRNMLSVCSLSSIELRGSVKPLAHM